MDNSTGANSPRREYVPISGRELAQVVLGSLAQRLIDNQFLGVCNAYPGAKVQFAMRILPQPQEEGREIKFDEQWTLDFTNPPDVIRILSGLPVWEQIKVQLDKYVQVVEKEVEAGVELKKAAQAQISGGKLPIQGGKR